MNNLSQEIISGKDLIQTDLDLINKYRKIRLNRNKPWDHLVNNHFHDRKFFLIKDEGNLVSFGTLRAIKIYIDNIEIEIAGIQAIISIIQGKGYGKMLMKSMINYANRNNLTLVGFCERHNAEFYRKSGLEVFEDKNENFIYINESGKKYTEEGDVIYYSAGNSKIKEALMQNKKILHYVPHW